MVCRTALPLAMIAAMVVTGLSPASAQAAPTAAEEAAAQALFDEGRRLLEAGQYESACPKLEESDRLAPGIGTKFHLADCNERLGRTATAWAGFLATAAAARSMGQTAREDAARDRARALEPRLARLVVEVPTAARASGLTITRDGLPVGSGQWGAAIPVDPGSHVVDASAPGKAPWHADVRVDTAGALGRITVPPLAEGPPSASGGDGMEADPGRTQRVVGLVVGGAGLVGVGVGAVFGLQAISKYDQSEPFCTGNVCKREGLDLRDASSRAGNNATLAFVAGGVATALGVVLYFTAPSRRPAAHGAFRLIPAPALGGSTLTLQGTF